MRNKELDSQMKSGTQDRSGISRLRLLDFDDLFLLSHLLEGNTIAATARLLGLTQPAITQRVRKIERVFGETMLQKAGRHVRLTKVGRAICVRARDSLALMRDVSEVSARESLTVGTEAMLYESWLWPVLVDIRERSPESHFHAYVGAPDEVTALLDAGQLSAALTTRAPGARHSSIELGDEEFVLVASPGVAASVDHIGKLEGQMLLEVDRSFGLLGRVEASARTQLKFREVWFVGGVAQVLAGVKAGHGVAVLPQRLVSQSIHAGQLRVILPELDIPAESVRLVYRADRMSEALIEVLAKSLSDRIAK